MDADEEHGGLVRCGHGSGLRRVVRGGEQEADEDRGHGSAGQLHEEERRHRAGGDAGERVGERPGDRDGGVGEAGRAGEPVRSGDVAADGERDRVGASRADEPKITSDQPDRGDDLGEPQVGRRSGRSGRGRSASRSNIRLASTAPRTPPSDLGADQRRGIPRADLPERPLDEGDDRVERRRDRLQGEDQRDQGGAGDQAVLQQLEADVVGGEASGGNAGARSPPSPGTRCPRARRRPSGRGRRSSGHPSDESSEPGEGLALDPVVDPDATLERSSRPTSCSTLRWWLIVGWERSKASLRSQTHASPSACEATSESSRRRTGSARALSSGAIPSACCASSGCEVSGEQHATVSTGVSSRTDFDMRLCCQRPMPAANRA